MDSPKKKIELQQRSLNVKKMADEYYDAISQRVTTIAEQSESQMKTAAQNGNVPAMLAISKGRLDNNHVLDAYEWLLRAILMIKRDCACYEPADQADEISEHVAERFRESFEKQWDGKAVTTFDDMKQRTNTIFKTMKELSTDPSWLNSKHLIVCDEKKWPELRAKALEKFRQEYNDSLSCSSSE